LEPLKVIYIMAYGRSGSTIVGNILGEIDGFVHVGELRYIWARTVEGRLCGCSAPVAECPFWGNVVPSVLESVPGGTDVEKVLSDQREGLRLRHLRKLLGGPASAPPEAVAYERVLAGMYRRIAEVTGARVIIDSSKRIADAALVGWQPSIKPYFVQLVRDPRAVAYSWQRTKHSPGEGEKEQLHRLPASVTARSWSKFAAGASTVRRRHRNHSTLLRYEDFAARPRRVIEQLVEDVGQPGAKLPFVDERTVDLGPNHTVGGNPVRFDSGHTAIRTDSEWMERQPSRDRLVVSALTIPLLLSYRYPIRPRPNGVQSPIEGVSQ
jgi:hypothetical protein